MQLFGTLELGSTGDSTEDETDKSDFGGLSGEGGHKVERDGLEPEVFILLGSKWGTESGLCRSGECDAALLAN